MQCLPSLLRQKPATWANKQGVGLSSWNAMRAITLTQPNSTVLKKGSNKLKLECQFCCTLAV